MKIFDETNLSKRESFCSFIRDEHVNDEDYDFSKKVGNEFEMKAMMDLQDI